MAYLFRTNSKCEKWAQRKPALGRSKPDIPTRNNFVLNLQITAINNINDGSPNPENEYRLRTRLSQESLENSSRQMENPQSESSFARPSRSEGRTNKPLMQVPPTRGQQRSSSRSLDHRRTTRTFGEEPRPSEKHPDPWRITQTIGEAGEPSRPSENHPDPRRTRARTVKYVSSGFTERTFWKS